MPKSAEIRKELRVGIDGIYRDISIRKNFEEAFRQTETRYRAIFDNMHDGVAVYQALDNGNDFVIVDFNVAGERIDKVRRDQIIGKSVLQVFPGVKEFGLFDTLKRVWSTGIPEDRPAAIYQDYRLRGWRENFVYKLPSGEVVAIYSDVTERMIANQALRESEERYRLLFDNLGEAIFVHDPSGRIVDANKIACERLDYPHAEIIKMSLADIDTGGHFPQMREKMESIGRSEHLSYETIHQCRDQRIFPAGSHLAWSISIPVSHPERCSRHYRKKARPRRHGESQQAAHAVGHHRRPDPDRQPQAL